MKHPWLALLIVCSALVSSHSLVAQAPDCSPTAGLRFICGLQNPEDVIVIPRSNWLLASGMAPGAGLTLVDTQSKSVRKLFAQVASLDREHTDRATDDDEPEHELAFPASVPIAGNAVGVVALEPYQLALFARGALGAKPRTLGRDERTPRGDRRPPCERAKRRWGGGRSPHPARPGGCRSVDRAAVDECQPWRRHPTTPRVSHRQLASRS